MKKRNIFLGIMCILLLGSCSVPDEDSPAYYFYLRFGWWLKSIERRAFYNTENTAFEIPERISVKNEIISQQPVINHVSFSKYYVNYAEPFELYIRTSLLDRKIKEVKFLKCKLIIDNNELNLFEISNEDIKLSEYKELSNGLGFSAGPYKGDFFNGYKFVVNNTAEEYFSGFSLGFRGLPFDYNTNEEIKILSEIVITDETNNGVKYTVEALFKRSFAEKRVEDNTVIWDEITFDEWKKYLK